MNDGLGDGQAKARSIRVQLLTRLVGPEEAVKQAGDHLLVDGRSIVDDVHRGSMQVALDTDNNVLTWRRVPDGVGQKIAQGSPEHQPVTRELPLSSQRQPHLLFFSKCLIEIK